MSKMNTEKDIAWLKLYLQNSSQSWKFDKLESLTKALKRAEKQFIIKHLKHKIRLVKKALNKK